jgi:hypothetical protein
MNGRTIQQGPAAMPPRQQPLRTAHRKAVAALRAQSAVQLQWLRAEGCNAQWRLPVMDGVFLVDINTGRICGGDGADVHPTWQVLTLRYLALRTRPASQLPAVTFASLPAGKTYAMVYENRVNCRLCAGVGKDRRTLLAAAAAVQARAAGGGDAALEINVFPRIPLRLVWYAGDEELMPSCTLLLPPNIDSFLSIEDIVVLSESFVSRLGGRPF